MTLGDLFEFGLNYGIRLLQSQLAVSALLLVMFLGLLIWTRKTLTRYHEEIRIALLEAQANLVTDASFISSLRNICAEYRALYLGVIGGKRHASPELARIDGRLDDLRRSMHDERSRRAMRLRQQVIELEHRLRSIS